MDWIYYFKVVPCLDPSGLLTPRLAASLSLSSASTASSFPARQEVASGAGVHGGRRSGAAGLPAPVEQRAASVLGVQLLHPAGLQAAGVPQPDTPAAAPAVCAAGTTKLCWFVGSHWMFLFLD